MSAKCDREREPSIEVHLVDSFAPVSLNLNANVVEMTRLLHSIAGALILLTLLPEGKQGAGHELGAHANATSTRAVTKVLSRQKRYLAFPEGSSVSV